MGLGVKGLTITSKAQARIDLGVKVYAMFLR